VQFVSYVIVPLRNQTQPVECAERNATFWGLYGIDFCEDAYAIGDFTEKTDAEFIRDALIASP